MVRAVTRSAGDLKRTDSCLDHDAHHSIHGHAGLGGQKESLTHLISGDQINAVSQERRQLAQPVYIPGLEKIILISNQLVLAKGRELQSAPRENGGIPVSSYPSVDPPDTAR